MDRNEFVSTLRGILNGAVPASVVEEHVRYYDAYISQEIAHGKSEQEVLESLGDPRLIAKTILDTQGAQNGYVEIEEESHVDVKYHQFNFNTWYGKILVVVILVLVLALIITIVGGILSWLLPILIPAFLIVWIVRVLFGRR